MLIGLDGPRATVLWWTLPSYLTLIAAALLISFGILLWETRRSWTLSQAANSVLIALTLGLFGARLEHVILHWGYFSSAPSEILNFAAGGLSAHGGIAGAAVGGWITARLYRNSLDPWLSAAAYACSSLGSWWDVQRTLVRVRVVILPIIRSWRVWKHRAILMFVCYTVNLRRGSRQLYCSVCRFAGVGAQDAPCGLAWRTWSSLYGPFTRRSRPVVGNLG